MLLDMNDQGIFAAEVIAFPDWPYTPHVDLPVREEVYLGGSTTGNTKTDGGGSAEAD